MLSRCYAAAKIAASAVVVSFQRRFHFDIHIRLLSMLALITDGYVDIATLT